MVVKMDKIITNKVKCRKCGDVIESVFTHDLKRCKCGAVEIDGGKEYLRRSAKSIDDFIELIYKFHHRIYICLRGKIT